jgi:hypothetical protein
MIKQRFHCCRKTLHINSYTIACRQLCRSVVRVAETADCVWPLCDGMFYLYRCMYWITHCLSENFTGPIVDGSTPDMAPYPEPAKCTNARHGLTAAGAGLNHQTSAPARVPDRLTGRRRCRAVRYTAPKRQPPWLGLPTSWWAEVARSGALCDTSPEPTERERVLPRSSSYCAADADPENKNKWRETEVRPRRRTSGPGR